ncbi:GumC family protein [Mesorhizobium sp. SP-1A]|uniref:GumC family protein n=1 Tax=Mesorhizobium sp. SP-1A TaxID=3077840 RepID=UPI0028F735D2|nr:GumC family protein [Mesorhizobium sp. SP-1A]
MNIDIFQLPGILKRRAHYVVLAILVCLALAFVFLLLQKPYYRSSTEMLLDLDRSGAVGNANAAAPQVSAQQSVGSQIYVVQSREVLQKVVQDLKLTSDPYLGGSGGGWRRLIFGGAAKPPSGDAVDGAVEALRKNLTVEQAGDSLVITVTVKHRNSEMAARIANAIAQTYLSETDQTQSSASQKTGSALREQTEELRQRLLAALAAAEKFRTEHGLISTGTQGLVVDQQLAGVNQQLLAARQAAEQQKTIADQASRLKVSDVETGAIAEALQSPTLVDLRGRYAQLLDRQAELSTNLGSEHPQMRAVRSQVASMRRTIENELQRIRATAANNYERAQANVAALQGRFDALAGTSGEEGEARIKLAQLQSEAASINAVYQSFLSRSEELGRQQDVGAGNSRVISAAVPSSTPIQAPKSLVLVAALLFGAALGSVLAVLRETFSTTLRSEQELIARTGAPVLVTVEAPSDETKANWVKEVLHRLPLAQRLLPSGGKGPGTPQQDSFARAALMLQAGRDPSMPTAVVVLSADAAQVGEPAAARIARQLHVLGEEVFLSDGSMRQRAPLATLAGERQAAGHEAAAPAGKRAHPLLDILRFQRVGASSRAGNSLLSLIPAGNAAVPFYIVDACGTEAESLLPTILKYADGILALSKIGTTNKDDLATLITRIGPWRSKLIGNIVVEKKAA